MQVPQCWRCLTRCCGSFVWAWTMSWLAPMTAAPTLAPRSSKLMRRGSCRRLSSGLLVSLWQFVCVWERVCVGVCVYVGSFAWQVPGLDQLVCAHVYVTCACIYAFFVCLCEYFLQTSSHFSVFFSSSSPIWCSSLCLFSFRFICQHSTDIPEVRGHAFHHGQDPCPWDSPSSSLHRLWVRHWQMPQTHSLCIARGRAHTLAQQSTKTECLTC